MSTEFDMLPKTDPRSDESRVLAVKVADSPLRAACDVLLANIGWPSAKSIDAVRSIGVTGCTRGSGVSTVAAWLAATAATTGDAEVLLVEANFRRPRLRDVFRVGGVQGLGDLADQADLAEAIQPTAIEHLAVMTVGSHHHTDGIELAPHLEVMLDELKDRFDLVVFDLPPVSESSLATRIGSLVDGNILVIEAERVRRQVARRTMETLRRSSAPILGCVLNKRRQHIPQWLYRWL